MVNDPLFPDAISQSAFDDEGVACHKTDIISNGVMTSLLHNLSTSKRLNTESTGNGFKGSVMAPVGVRPYNLYLEPKDASYEAMLESIDEGLVITSLQGLHAGVNAINGEFSLQSAGYFVKNGKVEHPVTLIVVSGNLFDVLNNIEMIGNDLTFTFSRVGSPSVKISSLSISGQ